jgi:hypothetical protein
MPTIEHQYSPEFTDEMAALRQQTYPGVGYRSTVREAQDATSTHLALRADGQLVGYIRLLTPPESMFEHYVDNPGAMEVPVGPEAMHCDRLAIHPDYPQLAELLTYLTFQYASDNNYRYIVGAIPTSLPILDLVARFGMHPRGPLITYQHPCGEPMEAQPTVCEVSQAAPTWSGLLAATKSRLAQQQISCPMV